MCWNNAVATSAFYKLSVTPNVVQRRSSSPDDLTVLYFRKSSVLLSPLPGFMACANSRLHITVYTMESDATARRSGGIHRDDPHAETDVGPYLRLSSDRHTEQSQFSGNHTMRSQITSPVENSELAVNEKTPQIIDSAFGPPETPSTGGGGPSCYDDGPDPSRAADYKPSPLRTWYLGTTLLVVIILFCLTVVARQTLPDGSSTSAPSVQIETNGNITKRDMGSHVNCNNEQHHPGSVRHSSHASAALYPYSKNVTKREASPQTPTGSFIKFGSTIVQGRANPFTLPNPYTLPTWAATGTQSGTIPSAIGRAIVVGTAQPTTSPKSNSQIPTHNHGWPESRDFRGGPQLPNNIDSSDVVAFGPMTTPGVRNDHSKRDTFGSMTHTPLESPQAAETTKPSSNSSSAIPTAMPTQPSSNSSNSSTYQSPPPVEETWHLYDLTAGQYFIGLMLPTFFTTLLAIPLRSIEFNYKLYRPFHNLLQSNGATAASSLFLPTTGLSSFFVDRDITTCSTISLLALSAVLVPISAEAIHLNLHGRYCHSGVGDADNCAVAAGVSPTFAYLAMAILLLMGALLVLTWTRLRRYRTAVPVKPWNVSFMEKFASDSMVSSMLSRLHSTRSNDKKDHVRVFDPWMYTIDAQTRNAQDSCRIIVLGGSSDGRKISTQTHASSEKSRDPRARNRKPASAYSFILTVWGRLLLMLILLGTLITVLVYSQNSEDNGFEHFMDSEKIGVRILFSSTGVALTTLWTSFFQGESDTSLYFSFSGKTVLTLTSSCRMGQSIPYSWKG